MGEGGIAKITGNEEVAKVMRAAEAEQLRFQRALMQMGDTHLQELSWLGAKL